jgi:hypothetical protein
MKQIAPVLAMTLALSPAALAADLKAQLHCATGPIMRSYGGTKWLVHSCTDGKSLVFAAVQGSPAAPFEFDLTFTGHGYDLDGKGRGKRAATDAAYVDLQKLKGVDVRALIKATQAVKGAD